MKGHVLIAIPGQPSGPAPVPADAVATAIAAIDALAAALPRTTKGKPAIYVQHWPVHPDVITTIADLPLTWSPNRWVQWSWGKLWMSHSWYEDGWHPCENILTMEYEWRRRLWDILNPYKRPQPDLRSRRA